MGVTISLVFLHPPAIQIQTYITARATQGLSLINIGVSTDDLPITETAAVILWVLCYMATSKPFSFYVINFIFFIVCFMIWHVTFSALPPNFHDFRFKKCCSYLFTFFWERHCRFSFFNRGTTFLNVNL